MIGNVFVHPLQGSPEERRKAARVNKQAMMDRAQKVPGVSRNQADQVKRPSTVTGSLNPANLNVTVYDSVRYVTGPVTVYVLVFAAKPL